MKKLTTLLLLVIWGMTAMAQNGHIDLRSLARAETTSSDFHTLKAVFSYASIVSTPVESPYGTFSQIALNNTYPSGEIGTPELPVTHELLAVPFGATPRVRITNYSTTDYRLSDFGINTIVPHQPSVRKDQNPDEVDFVYQANAYQKRGLGQSPEVSIEVQGTMRGIRVGSLVVNPVSYDPSNGVLRVFNDIEVEIRFDGADYEETERLLVSTYSPYFDIVYKQMFNYRAIQDVYDDHPDLWAAPVRMIVIANDMFQSALQPWIEWKTQKGFYMDVNYTSTIGSTSAAIKTFLQDKYNTGVQNNQTPTFVIIIGDKGQVPESAIGSASGKVTDLYYGSVDNDYYPDMFYSRMSAENATQLTAIIDKVLQYEQYTMPDPSYLDNVLLIAGADSYGWNPKVGQPTVNYATTYYYNTAHGFSHVYAYLNSYAGCYSNLSTGVGFANYTAHGSETSWANPSFTVSDVNNLTNTDKYFLAMGNCCIAANWGHYQPCFGEAMIRATNKAAYSYIGSCPNTYWYEDYYFCVGATNTFYQTPTQSNSATGVYDGIWTDSTYNTVSSITFLGNLAVCYAHANNYNFSPTATNLYYWQAYHVLGDGSVMPFRVKPTANQVSHAQNFPSGATSFTVNAQAGSYVGISRNNVLLGAALVPASGSVNVVVTPVTSGQVKIVVTKPQRQPYIQTINVGTNNAPNIQVDQVTPNTIENGVSQPLTVRMKNTGNVATTTNTTVTITSSDSYLSIINGTASFGPMAANGGTATVNNAFTVKAASNTPNNHVFNIQATATNEGSSWNSSFTLTSVAPCNAPTNLTATANGNSINLHWTASPTATSYRVFRGTAQIASSVTGTSYTDSNLSYGTQYCYTVKSNCTGGSVSDPSNQACATTADPCNAPTNLTATANSNSINLHWTASPTATSYRVFRGTTQIANNVTGTSYTDSNLSYGTQYCYTVKSNCTGGNVSDPSNQACATTADPCNAPTNLTATVQNTTNIVLNWSAYQLATSYKVYRNNTLIASNVTGTTYTDENLGEGHYCYTLTSICPNGESEPSNQACEDIDLPCDKPRNLDANYAYNSEEDFGVLVEWDAPAAKTERGLTKFNVYRSENGNVYDKIAQVDYSEELHYDYFEQIEPGHYFYQVKALYQWGGTLCESDPASALNNPANNYVSVTVTSITELSEATQVYPNPAHDKIHVKTAENITRLSVYNLWGVLVYSAENCGKQTEIGLETLPRGLYFMSIITSQDNKTVRLLKE
ncbi:MAG: C25 family cysteine peptidase [Candidatus Limimorpha sp.]